MTPRDPSHPAHARANNGRAAAANHDLGLILSFPCDGKVPVGGQK
jgi:hypothetical protein